MKPCPPEEEILRGLLDPMTPRGRADLTAHLAGCDRCRERWQRHRSLGYGPPEADPTPPPGPACPHPTDVETLVRDQLDPDAGRTARIHILGCPHCYARLDAALHAERRRRRESPDEGDRGGGMPGWVQRLRGGNNPR